MIPLIKSIFNDIIKKILENDNNKADNYYKNIDELYAATLTCPECKCSGQCIKYGKYSRHIIFDENNNDDNEKQIIKIQRVRCMNCNKTHALIPVFIIPFRIHEASFFILIVQAFLYKNANPYINRFKKDYLLWVNRLRCHSIEITLSNLNEIYIKCSRLYFMCLMQTHKPYIKKKGILFSAHYAMA